LTGGCLPVPSNKNSFGGISFSGTTFYYAFFLQSISLPFVLFTIFIVPTNENRGTVIRKCLSAQAELFLGYNRQSIMSVAEPTIMLSSFLLQGLKPEMFITLHDGHPSVIHGKALNVPSGMGLRLAKSPSFFHDYCSGKSFFKSLKNIYKIVVRTGLDN
jgi:hypothetical protein